MSREVNSAIAAALHARMKGGTWKTKAELLRDNVRLAREVIALTGQVERIENGMERFLVRSARRKTRDHKTKNIS